MELIGPEVAQSYAGFGILAITNLALVTALVFIYRAKETQRKEAEAAIAELQDKRLADQAKVIEVTYRSNSLLESMKLSIDNLAAMQIRGGRDGLAR